MASGAFANAQVGPTIQAFRISWPGAGSSTDDRYLIVVNLSDGAVQGRVHLPWSDIAEKTWRLTDTLSGASYDRAGNEMQTEGLYVDLQPWNIHCLQVRRL